MELPPHAKKVFAGVMFDVYQWEQELFDGSTATFERLKRPDSACVIPVMHDGTIVLLDEEQPGREPFLATPGGRVEEGEDPHDAALRELREETGLVPTEIELWFALQPTSKIDWAVFFLIAHGCEQVEQPQGEPGERLRQVRCSFDEFLAHIRSPLFRDRELTSLVCEAVADEAKMRELKTLFRIP